MTAYGYILNRCLDRRRMPADEYREKYPPGTPEPTKPEPVKCSKCGSVQDE